MKKLFHCCGFATLLLAPAAHAHYHCNVGALQQVPNTPLYFANGNGFITNSGFVLTMNLDTYPNTTNSNLATSTSATYAGYYVTSDINDVTFTALDSDPGLNFSPVCPGVQVCLRFVSVSGPAGGSFGVWDVNNFFVGDDYNEVGNDATMLTYSLPVGMTNGNNFIQLSENNGAAGADPFGHIHGRQFSATTPGLYQVTVQAYDNAHNGAGGGPVQTPTDLLPIYFQAGSQISALAINDEQVVVSYPAQLGTDYYLQATPDLTDTNGWQTIAGPISGNDAFQLFTDTNWNARQRFYRLQLTPTPE
jgi:hypothetical protein